MPESGYDHYDYDQEPVPSEATTWSASHGARSATTGDRPLRVYDIRHAAATTWRAAGVTLGEVARRMGHSAETLVSIYVGARTGDDPVANQHVDDDPLAPALSRDLKVVSEYGTAGSFRILRGLPTMRRTEPHTEGAGRVHPCSS